MKFHSWTELVLVVFSFQYVQFCRGYLSTDAFITFIKICFICKFITFTLVICNN
jgi:hypothetical protein